MNRSLQLDRRAFLKGIGGMALALPVLDAMGAEVTGQIPRRFCAIYTANGMSLPKAENGLPEWSWFPAAGCEWRLRLRQVDRAARALPQEAQLPGRALPSERSEGRPARLLRHVAHRRPAAESEARHLQLGRTRPGDRAAHQAVLPAAFAGALDRRRHRLSLPHRHHLVQPGWPADPGGEQSAPRLRPSVPRATARRCKRSTKSCSGASNWWTPWPKAPARSTSNWARPTASGWIST